jgi:uncharacterized short protein YbdD (DUF466 family)
MISFLAGFFYRSASTLRSIIGAPNYRKYLEHMKSAHPGDRVMSETEFNHTRMNDRYNQPGNRCC